jgi:hypothetical protein
VKDWGEYCQAAGCKALRRSPPVIHSQHHRAFCASAGTVGGRRWEGRLTEDVALQKQVLVCYCRRLIDYKNLRTLSQRGLFFDEEFDNSA